MDQVEKATKKQNKKAKNYIFSVGRRREAVARVRLFDPKISKIEAFGQELSKGDILVNGKNLKDYFKFFVYWKRYEKFLEEIGGIDNKLIFSVKVSGGGIASQFDAFILGISRSLEKYNKEKFRTLLKSEDYLTRDARERERRKVGMGGKARRKRQSPKR